MASAFRKAYQHAQANQGTLKYAGRTIAIALTWVPVVAYVANHVVWIGVIDGSSMTPTLNPESNGLRRDIALLWKLGLKEYKSFHRGDVVVLRNPRDPETSVVKRIVALEGEEVRTRFPYPESTCRVPQHHFWVEGDNIHSVDSNTYGPVTCGLITARVTRVLFPFGRAGLVPRTGGRDPREVLVKSELPFSTPPPWLKGGKKTEKE
ncbi:catalytic subunit of the mitochondrial inner membrane peptidase complex [Myxozyma melibiosi]|uniref:Mitochondrial inner membrane protease subunit 2 n=1 Tax=Myxozyma melibiosi TaxID=54550 RepID=A0ABR1F7L6_9ASCO